jgi:sugar transferase EpsL
MKLFPEDIQTSKRITDLVLTSIGMIVILPIIGLIALVVWIRYGRPVFFRQLRPGYRDQPFWVIKFRTMTEERDADGNLLPDELRMTALGRFLRTYSLDELPEFFNVLRGEMSIVGPRPLLIHYLDLYTAEQHRRHAVMPGITGWAQVNGRNILTWEDKFDLDVWYVDNWSLGLDFKIMAMTVWKVLKREGISQPGHVTAEEFTGSDPQE